MNEREDQIKKMLLAGIKAQWERLDDPKNVCKGKFSENYEEIKERVKEEYTELNDEFDKEELNYGRIRDEAADLKNYLDDIILYCDNKITEINGIH